MLAGIQACHDGLMNQRMKNFTLEAFKTWADRIHGSSGKDSWEQVFPPGHRLLQGLRSVYDFVEHYHTGGGLMRPLYAEFFREAAEALDDEAFVPLAEMYAELGRQWSDLADAALPNDVARLSARRRNCWPAGKSSFSVKHPTLQRKSKVSGPNSPPWNRP